MKRGPRGLLRASGSGFALILLSASNVVAVVATPVVSGSPAATSQNPPGSLCQEALPEGRARPKLTEQFPSKAYSGYVANLEVTVEHEPKETVMPGGQEVQLASKDATVLEHQGFILPSPKGPSKMQVERHTATTPASTTVRIPLLVLATVPEKATLTLPALPISVMRSNGEVFTLCTLPHEITVEDPTSSTPDPTPKPNPAPRRQLEEWTALKQAVEVGSIALVAGAILGTLFMLWRRRPKRVPPPPPPRPPWEVALEELKDLRRGELITRKRYAEHYDKASDSVRKYLGARFGFDGLESTTNELIAGLHQADVDVGTTNAVELYLRDADLVKFANLNPTEAECWLVLDQAEAFVHSTLPGPEAPTLPNDDQRREQEPR
jgi:hypothetical protein